MEEKNVLLRIKVTSQREGASYWKQKWKVEFHPSDGVFFRGDHFKEEGEKANVPYLKCNVVADQLVVESVHPEYRLKLGGIETLKTRIFEGDEIEMGAGLKLKFLTLEGIKNARRQLMEKDAPGEPTLTFSIKKESSAKDVKEVLKNLADPLDEIEPTMTLQAMRLGDLPEEPRLVPSPIADDKTRVVSREKIKEVLKQALPPSERSGEVPNAHPASTVMPARPQITESDEVEAPVEAVTNGSPASMPMNMVPGTRSMAAVPVASSDANQPAEMPHENTQTAPVTPIAPSLFSALWSKRRRSILTGASALLLAGATTVYLKTAGKIKLPNVSLGMTKTVDTRAPASVTTPPVASLPAIEIRPLDPGMDLKMIDEKIKRLK